MRRLTLSFLAAFAVAAAWAVAAAQETPVTIGSGGIAGVYYPAGGAICRMVNADRKRHGLVCSVESTGGSVDNLSAVAAGEMTFGIAQSDVQYDAFAGKGQWEGKPFASLRSVLALYPEAVTLIARADAGIASLGDLKGKRLNIGNPGSGSRTTWEAMEKALGWKREDLKLALELKSVEAGTALCEGRIDAYLWLVGHPSALTSETLDTCASNLVDVAGPAIDALVAGSPFYRKAVIPAGMYNNPADIATFGVAATLVTSADVPEEVVFALATAVMANLAEFKTLHPALAGLEAAGMIKDGLSAPLHPGAVKAFKELNLPQ
jgi:hypothetical protein